MSLLKKIGIILGVIVLLTILAIIFFPTKMNVSVTQELDASPQTVYNVVSNMSNDNQWNPWQQQDTSMVVSYGDIISGKGASMKWESKTMGSGSATFTEVIKNRKIVSEMDFGGMGGGIATYNFEPEGTKTKMTWTLDSETGRPWNLINFFIKRDVRKSYKQGMKALNELVKARTAGTYSGYEIKEELLEGRRYIMNRAQIPLRQAPVFYAKNLGPLFQKIQAAGASMSGSPSGLFFSDLRGNNEIDMAAGVPIIEEVNIQGAAAEAIGTKKALVVDYYGDSANSIAAHDAITSYMADRNLVHDWPIIEEYVTDPSVETDPKKWLTRVIYYLGGQE